MTKPTCGRLIEQLAERIVAAFPPDQPINVVGIRTRGEVLAARLDELLASRGYPQIGRGVLDITLYRDDLSEIGPRPLVRPTQLADDDRRRAAAAGGRRAVHRPIRPGGPEPAERLRPAQRRSGWRSWWTAADASCRSSRISSG